MCSDNQDDKEKLLDLIQSFYNLTGIKVAVYDNQFTEILAYPAHDTDFCTLLHKSETGCSQCAKSTERLCKQCVREKKVIIEKCHAGLTEAIAPIIDGVLEKDTAKLLENGLEIPVAMPYTVKTVKLTKK